MESLANSERGCGISHETIYHLVYADKASGGSLWKALRCQKKLRNRYAGGHDRRGEIIDRRPIGERPTHIEERAQITIGKTTQSLERTTSKPSHPC